jgi:hypothetical protein
VLPVEEVVPGVAVVPVVPGMPVVAVVPVVPVVERLGVKCGVT